MRRFLTAREQVEMLAPWRVAADVPAPHLYLHPDELAQYLNPANEIHPHKLDRIRQEGGESGIQFPIQVNTDGEHARIDDGHHRVTVAQGAGLDAIPVLVHPVDKYFFRGKAPGFAPAVGPGLQHWLSKQGSRRVMSAVTLFTKPDCPGCKGTVRELNKHGIPFQARDVTQDPEALDMVRQLGYSAVPVVHAGGDNHWSGFSPDRIKSLLG